MNKRFLVCVSWSMGGTYQIDAASEQEAKDIADTLPLPDNGEYMCDSFEIDRVVPFDQITKEMPT